MWNHIEGKNMWVALVPVMSHLNRNIVRSKAQGCCRNLRFIPPILTSSVSSHLHDPLTPIDIGELIPASFAPTVEGEIDLTEKTQIK